MCVNIFFCHVCPPRSTCTAPRPVPTGPAQIIVKNRTPPNQNSPIDLLNFVFLRPSLASQSSNHLPYDITCGTFPAFLCFPASFDIRNANSTYRYYYTRFVHTIRYYAVGSHARPAQINPAIYGPAAQRSAVRSRAQPCGAVPCPSLRCCVAALCAFFRT